MVAKDDYESVNPEATDEDFFDDSIEAKYILNENVYLHQCILSALNSMRNSIHAQTDIKSTLLVKCLEVDQAVNIALMIELFKEKEFNTHMEKAEKKYESIEDKDVRTSYIANEKLGFVIKHAKVKRITLFEGEL